jgi:hypothetical protein
VSAEGQTGRGEADLRPLTSPPPCPPFGRTRRGKLLAPRCPILLSDGGLSAKSVVRNAVKWKEGELPSFRNRNVTQNPQIFALTYSEKTDVIGRSEILPHFALTS